MKTFVLINEGGTIGKITAQIAVDIAIHWLEKELIDIGKMLVV